jgi:hypothetical protein
MPDVHSSDPIAPLRHADTIPEHACSGEVIEYKEFQMGQVRVAICSACGMEFRYLPDSHWLEFISPECETQPSDLVNTTISRTMANKRNINDMRPFDAHATPVL